MKHETLVGRVAPTYRLRIDEIERLKASPAAQLLSQMPYVAGCSSPDISSLQSLGILVTAHRAKAFDTVPGETIRKRLFDAVNLQGGNETVISYGTILLQLLSLEDHYQDQMEDAQENKYNPITSGEINYEKEKARLVGAMDCIYANSIGCIETKKSLDKLKAIALVGGVGNWL